MTTRNKKSCPMLGVGNGQPKQMELEQEGTTVLYSTNCSPELQNLSSLLDQALAQAEHFEYEAAYHQQQADLALRNAMQCRAMLAELQGHIPTQDKERLAQAVQAVDDAANDDEYGDRYIHWLEVHGEVLG